MNVDRLVMLLGGALVFASATLAWFASPWSLLLTMFVGLNMMQTLLTDFCPIAILLRPLGARPLSAFPK